MMTQQTENQTMGTCGSGVAGLNIAPEVPAMTMFRHIVFGTVINIISKFIFEEIKCLK